MRLLRHMLVWFGLVPLGAAAQIPAPYDLPRCVATALQQNADVLIAQKRLEETAGAIVEARAGFLPRLTSNATYEKLEADYAELAGASPQRRDLLWNVNVRLTETLFAGGAIRSRMAIARLRHDTRLHEYQATVDRVLLDVHLAYYEILRNQSALAVHQQAVNFLHEQVKNERARLEVGTGQKLNVLRAEVNLALEQAALVDARNRLRNSDLRLGELLALPGTEPVTVTGELAYQKFSTPLADCLDRALTQRPELIARDREIAIQQKQLVVDRSELLPRVELFAGYDVVSEPERAKSADHYHGYIAGVQVSWQLFDGFAAKGRLQATRARLGAAETALTATRRAIEAEVVRAYRDLQKAEENITTQTANVQLATESLQLATDNFGVGLTTQLELLQSQLDLTRAQTAELAARFDSNAALARLNRAMGSRLNLAETP